MAKKSKSVSASPVKASTVDSPSSSASTSASASNGGVNTSIEKRDTVQQSGGTTSEVEVEQELPEVQVNKWSLSELKTACDDAVKQYLSRPDQFKPSHLHTDVRLLLGYLSSLIALSASFYAYRVPNFQATRPYVLAAVVAFMVLSAMQNGYAKWVERDSVFEGRRKVFAGRIETQSLSVRSSCLPYTPIYHLSLSYTHSSNGGKTLIREFQKETKKPFNEMFDEDGKLVRRELERVLKGVLAEAQATQTLAAVAVAK